MKKLIMLVGVGVTAFTISAASSIYLSRGNAPGTSAPTGQEVAQSREPEVPAPIASSSGADEEAASGEDPILHPATPTPILAEEVIQLAERLRRELAQLKERRRELEIQETRLRILYDDVRAERQAIDALRKQVDQRIALLREQVAQLREEQRRLAEQRKAFQERLIAATDTEAANVRKMAEIFNSMPADAAALVLEKMANNGNLDTAVQVLAKMEPRVSAKVLAAMADPGLAAQISERLKDLQPVQTAEKPRR